MSKTIKGVSLIIILSAVLIFAWKNIDKNEPMALTPEELIEALKMEKLTTNSVTKFTPIFNIVDSSARLEFYRSHAVRTKKILMIYFYTNGCYFCEKMKNITFADSRVQEELNKNYVAISINYSQYRNEFKKLFNLNATPATIFFDRKGAKIEEHSFYGYQGAEDFYNRLEILADPF